MTAASMQTITHHRDNAPFTLNQKIAELKGDESPSILELFTENEFNHVNYSTALSRLARHANQSTEHRLAIVQDERFLSMLDTMYKDFCDGDNDGDDASTIKLDTNRMGVRSLATILHSLAKLRLHDAHLTRGLFQVLSEDNATAKWIVESKFGAPQAVASICWAAAKLQIPCPALFDELEAVATASSATFVQQASPQAISNICWAAAKLNVTSCPTFFQKVDAVAFRRKQFVQKVSPQALANTVWAFAKLGVPAPHVFHLLHDPELLRRQGTLPQHVSNIAWACAVSGWTIPPVFDALDAMFDEAPDDLLYPQVIANAAWACATLEVPLPQSLMAQLSSERFAQNASSHELAQALWATATLETICKPLCQHVAGSTLFEQESSKIASQSIAMILWSLSVFEWPAHSLVDQLDARVDYFLPSMSRLDRCHAARACAKNEYDAPRLFAAMETNVLPPYEPRQIATTLWAYAKMGIPAPNHWGALDLDVLMEKGNPQDLANCLWAYATLPSPKTESSKRLFAALDSRADWVVQEGTEQTISSCAWACGALQVYAPRFFDAILQVTAKSEQQQPRFGHGVAPQALSSIIWACGTLNISCPTLVDALWEQRTSFRESANPQTLSNTIWGLTILSQNRENLLHELWDHLLANETEYVYCTELATQMLHVEAIGRVEGLNLSPIPEELRSKLFSKLPQQPATPSLSCLRMSNLLTEHGWEHAREVFPLGDSKLLSIDMADSNKIAIEYNGPTHYLKNIYLEETTRENGGTVSKRRLLESLGWKVIWQDWKNEKEKTGDLHGLKDKLIDAGYCFPKSGSDTQFTDST